MSRVIVALDFASLEESLEFLSSLNQTSLFVKVGLELYLQNGPFVLKELTKRGYKIFLDLKLYDIPNTVYQTVKGLMKFEVTMLSVHAEGGEEMIKSAIKAVKEAKKSCKIICITQLTSKTQVIEKEQNSLESLEESVIKLAKISQKAGADGVVCSIWEVEEIKNSVSQSLLTVTPGIRFEEQELQDQKRVGSPKQARARKSDFIVVGRALKMTQNPSLTFQRIKQEFENG